MSAGLITNIQRFSINDGPGIRTAVFLKGCPLRCKWCHNPETHKANIELMHDKDKCTLCGACKMACVDNAIDITYDGLVWDSEKCIRCGECISACKKDAISFIGKVMTVGDVVGHVLRDTSFYDETGGGATITGGEPFYQHEYLMSLLTALGDEYIHTCIETCGYTSMENIKEAMPYVDLFLYDLKLANDSLHTKYTGVSNKIIIDNLKYIIENGGEIEVRIPLIATSDGLLEDGTEMANLLSEIGAKKVWLLPYHNYGEYKYQRLNMPYSKDGFRKPSDNEIAKYSRCLKDKGLNVLIEGESKDE